MSKRYLAVGAMSQPFTTKTPPEEIFRNGPPLTPPLQGTAADILKRAMIRVPQALKQHGLTGQSVHVVNRT